ncbi:MAG: helix-turn-helix transcriptional regulator [Armatimonadota bacterium]|jgi:MerR family transcriptional regulator/heat shock protein HspR|nr:MerR family transcriptional regulator [Armatimonadota bacterium]
MAHRDEHEPVYMISIAARLCEIHPQTLRLYERMGLIKPQRVGSKNRMYSDADIERVRQIQRLTHELGVNLAGVEVILSLLEQMENMRRQMDEEMDNLRAEMEETIHRAKGQS